MENIKATTEAGLNTDNNREIYILHIVYMSDWKIYINVKLAI